MEKKKKEKGCGCNHNVGHSCNARFCWCEAHWEEGVKAGFIKPNNENSPNKQNQLEDIERRLRENTLIPKELGDNLGYLAGEYGFWSSRLEDILLRKPAKWNELRKEKSSDRAAERAWEATEDGVNEMTLRLKLKRLEKLMSAVKTIINIKNVEVRNQW